MLTGLRHLHEAGYLHRDVKPGNCCIGYYNQSEVYVLDFGMTRPFRNADGTIRTAREYAGFRGTVRYASPNVHKRLETGPGDDLVSLLYAIVSN